MSVQWWERLAAARGISDAKPLVEPDALLYYWPYGRHGINFHPPLAGQLDLLTYALFGRWVKDIPARRLASVFEYALTIAVGFGFLARRYGVWVGAIAAGALLVIPRVYGDGHIAGTDTPGLLLWVVTTFAFWKGLYEPGARRWRMLVGVLVGLAFVEKMGAVLVLLPLLGWLVVARLPRTFTRPGGANDWSDGLATSLAMLLPLAVAFAEILRLAAQLPPPSHTNLFVNRPPSRLPGAILAAPLLVWVLRRLLARLLRGHRVWRVERPALEIWTSILAFAPLVGWLGNPAWWRETMPRLAHYYVLSLAREGALPDIHIYYLGETYKFSLPWHNAWVLTAVTVPASLLLAAVLGVVYTLGNLRRDRLPLFCLINLVTLPVLRMLPAPAHDGVRLFLPTFFFLAAMAGWGALWLADCLARGRASRVKMVFKPVLALFVLAPAAWQLIKVHPYELSYYNELICGPAGAWRRGFELAYWYDAFNDRALTELNARLPRGAVLDFLNERTRQTPTFSELQTLGELRSDLVLGVVDPNAFPYVWLLTQDSKASPLTRLFFAMTPWYELRPRQLDHLRVATVVDPVAVSRAWALELLASGAGTEVHAAPASPYWVQRHVPWLGRFWGDGLPRVPPPGFNATIFDWAQSDPAGLRAAAQAVAGGDRGQGGPQVGRLLAILARFDQPGQRGGRFSSRLLKARPAALVEAVEILIRRPESVRTVLTRFGYTDPATIGGYLDRALPRPQDGGATASAERASRPPRLATSTVIGRMATTANTRATPAIVQPSQ
jgi:hypothetical protein